MVHLQFLFLHNNSINEWEQLEGLTGLKSILHLTLYSNPI